MKRYQHNSRTEGGQVVIIATLFFLVISLIIILSVSASVARGVRATRDIEDSRQSFVLAESLGEDLTYRVINSMEYSSAETLTIGGYTANATVSDVDGTKQIIVQGDVDDSIRRLETDLSISGGGTGVYYASQAGAGGFKITGGSTLDGNVYSNGVVEGASGVITGSVIAVTSIEGTGGSKWYQPLTVQGDSWSDAVTTTRTDGTLYCQTSTNNYPPPDGTPCDTSRGVPSTAEFPITEETINDWKEDAEDGGVTTGNVHIDWAGGTLGPQKITGNLTVDGGGTLTLTGPLWIEGTISVSGGGKVVLDSSYEAASEVVIADGVVNISGAGNFAGSGTEGSYPVVLTTSSANPALSITGGAGAVVLISNNGTLKLNGGSAARALSAYRIEISGGGTVTYEEGLTNLFFSSGPSGGFEISGWEEI